MTKINPIIIGADVGSVSGDSFAWAALGAAGNGHKDPHELATLIADHLRGGQKVAIALECPLSIPIPPNTSDGAQLLGKARQGETYAWSGLAGAIVLSTGLAQLAWLLSTVKGLLGFALPATTQLERFTSGESTLLIAEAMVTGDGKPQPTAEQTQHDADALASAIALQRVMATGKSDVSCAPHTPLNLAAVAAIHAGLDIDEGELQTEVLVAKA